MLLSPRVLKVLGDVKMLGSVSNDFKTGTSDLDVMATEPRKKAEVPLSNRRGSARVSLPAPLLGKPLGNGKRRGRPAWWFIGLVSITRPARKLRTSRALRFYTLLIPSCTQPARRKVQGTGISEAARPLHFRVIGKNWLKPLWPRQPLRLLPHPSWVSFFPSF